MLNAAILFVEKSILPEAVFERGRLGGQGKFFNLDDFNRQGENCGYQLSSLIVIYLLNRSREDLIFLLLLNVDLVRRFARFRYHVDKVG